MALDFFAGCVGGAAGLICGHPLDTVKVRLQTQSPDNIKYRGTFHTLSTIVKQESIPGLFKGIVSPLYGVAAINAIVFGVYGTLRPFVAGPPGHDALWAHFMAGAASGGVQSIISSPMELIKIRMQMNESAPAKSSLNVLKNIFKNEGGLRRGVFKGWATTLSREIPGFGFYFATYEFLTTRLISGREIGTFDMLMAGGMSGVVSWVVTYPTDAVKTRIQMDVDGKYNGIVDCVKKMYQNEGIRAFTRGLSPAVLRAFPTNAATFTVVTWIIRLGEDSKADLQTGNQTLSEYLAEWDVSNRLSQEKICQQLQFTMPQPQFLTAQSFLKSMELDIDGKHNAFVGKLSDSVSQLNLNSSGSDEDNGKENFACELKSSEECEEIENPDSNSRLFTPLETEISSQESSSLPPTEESEEEQTELKSKKR